VAREEDTNNAVGVSFMDKSGRTPKENGRKKKHWKDGIYRRLTHDEYLDPINSTKLGFSSQFLSLLTISFQIPTTHS